MRTIFYLVTAVAVAAVAVTAYLQYPDMPDLAAWVRQHLPQQRPNAATPRTLAWSVNDKPRLTLPTVTFPPEETTPPEVPPPTPVLYVPEALAIAPEPRLVTPPVTFLTPPIVSMIEPTMPPSIPMTMVEVKSAPPPIPVVQIAPLALNGRYIVLKDDKLIEGAVTVTGEVVNVRQGTLERQFVKSHVQFVAGSKDEVYQFMLAKVPVTDTAARLNVARWCMFSGMREQALTEARAIVKLEPTNTIAADLARSLELSLQEFPPGGVPKVAVPATPMKQGAFTSFPPAPTPMITVPRQMPPSIPRQMPAVVPIGGTQFGSTQPPKPPVIGPMGGDEFDPAGFNQGSPKK